MSDEKGIADIVDIDTNIPGLHLYENAIDTTFQQDLLDTINALLWDSVLKRRVQHYGYIYPYKGKVTNVSQLIPTSEFPDIFYDLLDYLKSVSILPEDYYPDQAIVNEYQPGEGISGHTDNTMVFEDLIVSVTLGSGCIMIFKNTRNGEKTSFYLSPGSVLVMEDGARYDYTHEIPKVKTDTINGTKVKRGTRISITFRKIKGI